MIKLTQSDAEIAACFDAMKQLRTALEEDAFVPLIRNLMKEGYQLAYLQSAARVVCVAGFKVSKNLFLGKHLYVEDLSTLEHEQSKKYGTQMIHWLRQYAKNQGCHVLHLDSGVQRFRAHKFYLNQNMNIACYHFVEWLT